MKRHKRIRKRKSVFTSFAAASVFLGYSPQFLKQIRDVGAPGFNESGRIDCAVVKKWMLDNPTKLPVPILWKDKLGEERLRREKRANDYEEGLLVEKLKVAEQFQKVFRPVLARVEQMLINEYPSKVAGLDVPAARCYAKRVYDLILEAHREAVLQWQT